MSNSKLNIRYILNIVLTKVVQLSPLVLLLSILSLSIWAYVSFGSSFYLQAFSTDEAMAKFLLDFSFKAFLLVAVIQIYILVFVQGIDKVWAKYIARNHVVIVAGREGLVRRSGMVDSQISTVLNIRSVFQEKQKVAESSLGDSFCTAVEFAQSISLSEKGYTKLTGNLLGFLRITLSTKVVFCAPAISQIDRERLWKAGVCIVENDYEIDELFNAVGGNRAKIIYVMRDSCLENLGLSQSFLQKGKQLQVRCLIESYEMRLSLNPEDFFEQSHRYRLRFFNESELIARTLLHEYGPDGSRPRAEQVHVLIIGLGSVGTALMLHLARIGQFRDKKPVQITLISRDAEETLEELRAGNNCFNEKNKHCPVIEAVNSNFFGSRETSLRKIVESVLTRGVKPSSIYICTKDELVNLRVARVLEKLQSPRGEGNWIGLDKQVPIVVLDPPGGTLLSTNSFRQSDGGGVKIFSLTRRTSHNEITKELDSPGNPQSRSKGRDPFHWSAERLDTFFDDDDAKSYHDEYVAAEKLKGKVEANWEQIDETFRESNRYRSEFFPIFLRALGLQEVVEEDSRPAITWGSLSEDEQRLAEELEHNFWWQGRMLENWELVAEPSLSEDEQKLAEDDKAELLAKRGRLLKAERKHWLLKPYERIIEERESAMIEKNEAILGELNFSERRRIKELEAKIQKITAEIKKDENQIKMMFSKVTRRGNKLVRSDM